MNKDYNPPTTSSRSPEGERAPKVLDISWGTIFKIAITFLTFYILYLIKDILIWAIFALIISVLFDPAIDFLQRRRLPRVLATIFIYIVFFGMFGFLIYLIAPAFISEIQQFTQLFPQYFEKLAPPLKGLGFEAFENFEVFTQTIQDWLVRASSNIFNAIFSFFGGIFSAISIFILAVFLSLEEKGIERIIELISPKNYETYILNLWGKCQRKVSGWFGARILSSMFVGLAAFLTCRIFNVRYALSFGFLAGILDIIPIGGPIIAGTIIAVFSAIDSWFKALFVLIAFILIQQIEGNILTPLLTRKFVGLPPFLVLIALMVGGKLGGVLGAVLSIPLAGIIYEFSRDFLKKRKADTIKV